MSRVDRREGEEKIVRERESDGRVQKEKRGWVRFMSMLAKCLPAVC